MTIYLGADHRGFQLKEYLKEFLTKKKYEISDLGAEKIIEGDDYPEYASKVAKKISENPKDRGIVICGSGAGVEIVANKFNGVRAVLSSIPEQAAASRRDDDTNVLALAAEYISEKEAEMVVERWLETEFAGEERFVRRLNEISDIENKSEK